MSVLFSSASLDENGGISGGKSGDQTGKEVRTTNAYQHSQGWRIFRYPNSNIAYWIGTNARVMADNNNFGYDQSQRSTGYEASKSAGWEPANVTTPCELDCSSFVRTAVACALEKDIANFNTETEPNVLLNLGFIEITGTPLSELKLGDIVCTVGKGHTEIVSSGSTVRDTTNQSAQLCTHIVKANDTLWGISVKYYGTGLKYSNIMKANNLATTRLNCGQILIIPK